MRSRLGRFARRGRRTPTPLPLLQSLDLGALDYGAEVVTALSNAAKKARLWTERRDRLVRQLHSDGQSLRAIAEQAGMTHAGIARIVKKL